MPLFTNAETAKKAPVQNGERPFARVTAGERDEIGGVEYKAVSFLSVIVFHYFILFIVFGMIGKSDMPLFTNAETAKKAPVQNGERPFARVTAGSLAP
jgi:uncharacterized protein YifE (UPF0438 family)